MSDRLDELMAAHLAGTLDEAGGAELLKALDVDPSLTGRLAGQMAVHRWLEASAAGPVSVDAILKALPGKGPTTTKRVLRRLPKRPSDLSAWLLPLLIAALLAGLSTWWMAKASLPLQPDQPAASIPPAAPSRETPAAMPGAQKQEQTIDLQPIADGDVDETDKSMSSGHQPTLRVRGGEAGRGQISLLRFAIPPGQVLRGQLILRRIDGDALVAVRAQGGVGEWTEDDLRYWHLPPRGQVLGPLVQQGEGWSVTLGDLRWAGQMEFMLDAKRGAAVFGSREDAAHAPILRLTLIPGPAPGPVSNAF